jgi:ubiquinone/menaquinone biosynthesis C-methylase UbiE
MTTVSQTDIALRERLHGMWSAVAPGWAANADFISQREAHVDEAMLAFVNPQPGQRVLELACGPGGPGLEAAEIVGRDGAVVISDVSAEMTAIAASRAERRGLLCDATFRVLDLEEIDEPDAAFDVVLCREGLMLVADPARAAREIRRVLAPGGRLALTVWGPRERNPWLGVVFDAASAQLGLTIPPPGMPGPFSLQDAGALAGVLSAAGLSHVGVTEIPAPYRAESAREWWRRTAQLAGPLSSIVASMSPADRDALRDRATEAIAGYKSTTDGSLDIPGVCLLATGIA